MFKKLIAALGITGAIYWVTKKRRQGDEFQFTELPPEDDRPPAA